MKAREKATEKALSTAIKSRGGWSIKLPAIHFAGLPDRLCLLPGGVAFFVEVKSEGEKPRPVQRNVHRRLRALGFEVYIIDTPAKIYDIIYM